MLVKDFKTSQHLVKLKARKLIDNLFSGYRQC